MSEIEKGRKINPYPTRADEFYAGFDKPLRVNPIGDTAEAKREGIEQGRREEREGIVALVELVKSWPHKAHEAAGYATACDVILKSIEEDK